jgi:hypothetical protein
MTGIEPDATPLQGPVRVQRRRSAGWRMPAGTVYVGRPTQWGNPYPIADYGPAAAVARYRAYPLADPDLLEAARRELRGRDQACWYRLDAPCHADVLVELANGLNVTPDTPTSGDVA